MIKLLRITKVAKFFAFEGLKKKTLLNNHVTFQEDEKLRSNVTWQEFAKEIIKWVLGY